MSFNLKKPKDTAYQRACYMLGRKDYGKKELIRKLIEKGFEKEEANTAVDKLSQLGWQDEQRAANSLVRSIYGRNQGLQKLKMTATQRQLDWKAVEKAIEEEDPDWKQSAKELVARKFGEAPYEKDIQIKIARTLIQRGFSMDTAWKEARRQDSDEDFYE